MLAYISGERIMFIRGDVLSSKVTEYTRRVRSLDTNGNLLNTECEATLATLCIAAVDARAVIFNVFRSCTPDIFVLQFCTPKVLGAQFKLYKVYNLLTYFMEQSSS
jgi:hypothetical protein